MCFPKRNTEVYELVFRVDALGVGLGLRIVVFVCEDGDGCRVWDGVRD